jgi:hypothetical protein
MIFFLLKIFKLCPFFGWRVLYYSFTLLLMELVVFTQASSVLSLPQKQTFGGKVFGMGRCRTKGTESFIYKSGIAINFKVYLIDY